MWFVCVYTHDRVVWSPSRIVFLLYRSLHSHSRYSVRPLLLHFFTTQRAYNDLINRSPSISPGRNLEAGDILGGRVTSGREWRSHRGQARGPLSSSGTLRSASSPLLLPTPPPPFSCALPLLALLLQSGPVSPSCISPGPVSSVLRLFLIHFFLLVPLPAPLHRATADTRRSYALHIQGDCIIHNDPTRR